MAWVDVDDVLRAASSEQEDRYQRPSPYKEIIGNPFGTPIHCRAGCGFWRVTRQVVRQHELEVHGIRRWTS